MPPKVKFTKEQLVDVAFDIAKEEGFDGITIRKVANRLGSSIAPIYVNFSDLEELKQEVVTKTINLSQNLIEEQNSGDRFLDIGIASVIFAKQYPLLFNDVVLNNNTQYLNPDEFKEFTIKEMKKDP
ncbi:MAG: TetR/AcrR family transcriptional regulator, partial [Romboutsia sp.]|uniref:TetR/AcrR family transcriptional regulator n=1 Tax=Romboutsia sp. TaxID=1965302 RepID=UPI003F2E0044